MSKLLSQAQIEQYERDGYLFPIRVVSEDEAVRCRQAVERVEREHLDELGGALRHKPHLILTCLDHLVRNERLLDAVEDLIGSDILCWTSAFFTKEAADPSFVSWHQDSTYWGLSAPDVVTAWVALSAATVEAGAMRVIPGSHTRDQIPHRETYHEHNLLTRGQEVMVEVDERDAADIVLAPGEMSLHHVRLIHGSGPNRSGDRRIGLAIRYFPTSVRQLLGTDSALLVRGEDRYGHFAPDTSPEYDLEPAAIARYLDANESHAKILYTGAEKRGTYHREAVR